MTWRELILSTRGRWAILFSLATIAMMVLYMPTYYSEVIDPKPGILLNDPVLNLFTPVDLSTPIFVILTIAIVQTILSYAGSPTLLMKGVMTFCLVNIVRMITMYLYTLEPPTDMIPLIDPISASLVYPDKAFAKDLFFSGHVSTMMVMVFVERNKWWNLAKVVGAFLMGLFLAWQHVHYAIDLIVAPLATYLVFLGVQWYIRGIPSKNIPLEPRKP